MNIKNYLAAAAVALMPLCSQASVVYEWTYTNGQTPWGITLQMEFDDDTVNAGSFKFDYDYRYEEKVPELGLLNMRYTFPFMQQEMTYTSAGGAGYGTSMGYMNLDLVFGTDGFLSGRIYLNDQLHHIDLDSIGKNYTVIDANSDLGMDGAGCSWMDPGPCAGATGYMKRVEPQIAVPEPGTFALFGLGLLAAGAISRRTRPAIKA